MTEMVMQQKKIKSFSSYLSNEGHLHMSNSPSKCDPIDFKFAQNEHMVV